MSQQNWSAAPRLDPRSPLVLDTRELGRRPGSMRSVSRCIPAPAHLAVDVSGVPEGSPLELDLRLESVVEGVLVSGTVVATVVGECVRCLDPVHSDLEADLQELYAYPGREREALGSPEGSDEDLDEQQLLDGDLLDLEPVLRDAVVLALPLQPLCRVDCPGLCVQCGARLADDPAHQHEEFDPRWAALQAIQGDRPGDLPD